MDKVNRTTKEKQKFSDYELVLPPNVYYVVLYGNGYEILRKNFSAPEFATPFIEMLKKNPYFIFLEFRKVQELVMESGKGG